MSASNAPDASGPAAVTPATQADMRSAAGFQQALAGSRLLRSNEDVREAAARELMLLRGYDKPQPGPDLGVNTHANAEYTTHANLRKDEWVQLDDRLIEVARPNLTLIEALRSRGLTRNTDLSNLTFEWEDVGDFSQDADLDMAFETRAVDEGVHFELNGIPLPIVHKSYHLNRRNLMASRNRGEDLDTTYMSRATRKVVERLEDLVLNGWGSTVDSYNIPSLLGTNQQADINTATSNNDWDDTSGTTADDIRTDVLTQIETLENENYGPEGTGYLWLLDRASWQALRARDTGTDQERGLQERINEEFGDILDPVRMDRLATGTSIMLKPIQDVIELVVASDLQNVEWESHAGFTMHMKVMGSITPAIKSDQSGQSGIHVMDGLLS